MGRAEVDDGQPGVPDERAGRVGRATTREPEWCEEQDRGYADRRQHGFAAQRVRVPLPPRENLDPVRTRTHGELLGLRDEHDDKDEREHEGDTEAEATQGESDDQQRTDPDAGTAQV